MRTVKIISIFLVITILFPSASFAQRPSIRQAAKIGFPMPDFELPSFQGETISISKLKGKNILIIFPRGRYENQWCRFCHYVYAELVDMEKKLQIRKKYNLEIIQVMPYTRAEVEEWTTQFKRNLGEIENWKSPTSQFSQSWKETARKTWPKKFDYSTGKPPLPFPILIDADRKVSIGLDLFRTEWNLSRVEQNIPTTYIIDKDGILRFKYVSQLTMDRPTVDYLLKFIDRMILND